MGLLTQKVDIKINNRTYKYYEDLGYVIPRYYNKKKKKWQLITGSIISVKIEDLQRGSGVKVQCQCDYCKNIYEMQYCVYLKHDLSKGFFCQHCSHKFLMSQENHPNWNPNLTDEERKIGRNYPEYKEFVKRVLIRDNYTCYRCGSHDHNNVAVHHLDGYDWCVEKRTDDTNAVCLCKECHSNFHANYGVGSNTKEQFEEWMGKDIAQLNKYNGKVSPAKEVICLEDRKIYKSCLEASRAYNADAHQINYCCNEKEKYLSVQGLHFIWYEKYKTMSENDIKLFLETKKHKNWVPVICITTNKIFDSASIAARYYNMKRGNDKILKACKGERRTAGKDPVSGTPLVWKYYNSEIFT